MIEASLFKGDLLKADDNIRELNKKMQENTYSPREQQRYTIDILSLSGEVAKFKGQLNEARIYFQQGQQIDQNNPFNNFKYAKFEPEYGDKEKTRQLGMHALHFHPEPSTVKEFLQTL